MTTATDTHEVVTCELRIDVQVDVPLKALEQYDTPLDELHDDQILDIIGEDTDLVPDALAQLFEEGGFTTAYVGVEVLDTNVVEKPTGVELYKPDGFYTLPVPNMISGNVRFTESGIEPVEVSNVNLLTDDQLQGAYYAVKRVWGLRGMHRYQKEQIGELLSELQWAMLARPSRHVFQPITTPTEHFGKCHYCGNPPEGHLVREPKDGE